jgi:2-(1,2-epoxy-1,2-dihydrophenyl)acetyl-CoA isomerase
MATELVSTERHGAVLAVTLNSPDTRNSLTLELREQLGAAIALAERDRSVRSVFLSGAGSSFCSGGDFKMLQQASTPWPVHRRFRQYSRWLTPLTMLEKPVVVGVHGYAVGGGMGLALTGDMLIAGESTQFVAGFFRLGAVPDIGVMYQLPRLIGMARAKNFLFGGQLRAAGLEAAQRLASGPAEVMGLAKMLMARSFEHSLEQMFTYEGLGQALAMSSAEFGEGFHAALEKRSPDFAAAAARAAEAGQ